MKRIVFLTVAFLISFSFMASAAIAGVELKLAHFMPPMHIQHKKNFVPFAEKVAELTNGEVKIKIYPSGALGGPKQLYDAVRTGITDIAFVIPSYVTGRFPRSSSLELPFLFKDGIHLTEVAYDLFEKYFAEDFKEVQVLYFYAPGLGQLHSSGKPILSASDLGGVKVRSPNSLMSQALSKLGANPVGMPISKLAVSLQKGVINGVLTPYSAITDFKLFDLVKSVTKVDLYGTFMIVVMNKKKFESLSAAGRKAIMEAGGKQWGLHVARVYDEHDQNTLKKIKAENKIKLNDMPAAEIEKMKADLAGLYTGWVTSTSKKGIAAQEILDSLLAAAQAD